MDEAGEKFRVVKGIGRILGILVLILTTLFYLQFGLQALFQSPPQGLLTILGTAGLGTATYRLIRRRKASAIVFWSTLPLFLFHVPVTIIDPGEMPFLIGSSFVPVLAGIVWLIRRGFSSPETLVEEAS